MEGAFPEPGKMHSQDPPKAVQASWWNAAAHWLQWLGRMATKSSLLQQWDRNYEYDILLMFVTLQVKRKQIREATDLFVANGALMTAGQECGFVSASFK